MILKHAHDTAGSITDKEEKETFYLSEPLLNHTMTTMMIIIIIIIMKTTNK